MRSAACITTHNEQDTIASLVGHLRSYVDDVFVADTSLTWPLTPESDMTPEIAARAGAHVIHVGRGTSYRDGMLAAWCAASDYDAVLQIDAGGSHRVQDGRTLLEAVWYTHADMGIGCRFHCQSKYVGRPWRKWATRSFAAAMNLRYHEDMEDWTSGLRVFRRPILLFLLEQAYRTEGHAWNAEVLRKAVEWNAEIMIGSMNYTAGRSSLRFGRTLREMWKLLV